MTDIPMNGWSGPNRRKLTAVQIIGMVGGLCTILAFTFSMIKLASDLGADNATIKATSKALEATTMRIEKAVEKLGDKMDKHIMEGHR